MTKNLIVVFVVLAFLVLIIVISSTFANQPNNSPNPTVPITPTATTPVTPSKNIAISYTITTMQSFPYNIGSYSYTQEADAGKIFVKVSMTIKNNGYSTFNTNPSNFALTTNNVKYTYDANTYSLNQWETVDVLNDGTYTGTLLYQVPSDSSSITMSCTEIDYSTFTNYNVIWTDIMKKD